MIVLSALFQQDSTIGGNVKHEKNSKLKSLGPRSVEILDSTPVLGRLKLGPQHTEQCGWMTQ